jgi:hypothetical protein
MCARRLGKSRTVDMGTARWEHRLSASGWECRQGVATGDPEGAAEIYAKGIPRASGAYLLSVSILQVRIAV